MNIRNNKIHYKKWGNGTHQLICIHGYGESASVFEPLIPHLQHSHTVYAFEWPHHGLTLWEEDTFTLDDLTKLINQLVPNNVTFSILANSIGARMALCLISVMQSRILKLVLTAPEGFYNHMVHRFATTTPIGQQVFLYTIQHPKWLLSIINLVQKIPFINKSLLKFARLHIENQQESQLLYKRWMALRLMQPDKQLLKSAFRQSINVICFLGKSDKVINEAKTQKVLVNLCPNATIITINAGHHLLTPANTAQIAAAICN